MSKAEEESKETNRSYLLVNDVKYCYTLCGIIETMPPFMCYSFDQENWIHYVIKTTCKRCIVSTTMTTEEQPTGGPELTISLSDGSFIEKGTPTMFAKDGQANDHHYFDENRITIEGNRIQIWFQYDSNAQCIRPLRLEVHAPKKE